jgi:hypothetical protein
VIEFVLALMLLGLCVGCHVRILRRVHELSTK